MASQYLSGLIIPAPKAVRSGIKMLLSYLQGIEFAKDRFAQPPAFTNVPIGETNPLLSYFSSHTDGPGIWKFHHYFDVYHTLFSRFVGKNVRLMEVGICGGGSLQMWREYLGPKAHVYGVDVEPACSAYQAKQIEILIGDQGDRAFWQQVKATIPKIDILIDDGSHIPEHQKITFEEMIPHLNPGGLYLCEDIQGMANSFAGYLYGLVAALNSGQESEFVKTIDSIHFYPFIGVVRKRSTPRQSLQVERRGTEWPTYMRRYWPQEFTLDGSWTGPVAAAPTDQAGPSAKGEP